MLNIVDTIRSERWKGKEHLPLVNFRAFDLDLILGILSNARASKYGKKE